MILQSAKSNFDMDGVVPDGCPALVPYLGPLTSLRMACMNIVPIFAVTTCAPDVHWPSVDYAPTLLKNSRTASTPTPHAPLLRASSPSPTIGILSGSLGVVQKKQLSFTVLKALLQSESP